MTKVRSNKGTLYLAIITVAALGLAGWLYTQLRKAKEINQKAKTTQQTILNKTQKLRNTLDFYDDKFALINQGGYFYFIDKEGNEVEKLGRWNN